MTNRVGFNEDDQKRRAGRRRNYAKILVLLLILGVWGVIGVAALQALNSTTRPDGFLDYGPFLMGLLVIEMIFGFLIIRFVIRAVRGDKSKPPTDQAAARAREAARDPNITPSGEDAV